MSLIDYKTKCLAFPWVLSVNPICEEPEALRIVLRPGWEFSITGKSTKIVHSWIEAFSATFADEVIHIENRIARDKELAELHAKGRARWVDGQEV